MTQHEPTKRIKRQREQRRAERQQERHIAKVREAAARSAYARDGIAGALAAIGGGDADFWDQDADQTPRPISGPENGVCDDISDQPGPHCIGSMDE